jgi:hypothetical protein
MKVATLHPQYSAMVYIWRHVRDFIGGSSSVKRQNTLYLPIPSAMTAVKAPSDASTEQMGRSPRDIGGFSPSTARDGESRLSENVPWYYPTNKAYESYLRRARVPDMTSFALRGLLGIATRKAPEIELPVELEYLVEHATNNGFSLTEMFSFMVSQIVQFGRVGLLLDVKDNNQFVFKLYSSEACINWGESIVNGDKGLSFVVLQEDMKADLDDPFSHEVKAKYLVMTTDENSNYKVDCYEADKGEAPLPEKMREPSVYGKRVKKIPFIFAGSIDNTPDVDESPLQGVADIAQHIYMKEADLANAEFMTCNPTLILSGVEDSEGAIATGSNVIIKLSDPQARGGYTETDTGGLGHVLKHIESLTAESAAFGASLLGARKSSAESAETVRLQQSVGGATLQSAVVNAGSAIETLLEFALEWSGKTGEVTFTPSTEFSSVSLGAQDITALMTAYMQGGISIEVLVENWRRAGILLDGDTIEDEISRLSLTLAGSSEDDDLAAGGPTIIDDGKKADKETYKETETED